MSNDILRAAAMFECENAMARHCYHHARGTHRDELEEIWHSDPARHHWKMMKSVMKSYVEGQENSAKAGYYRRMRTHPEAAIRCHDYRYLEEISVHVLSTPVIKASSDGTAVRAFWFTPGYVAPTLPDDVYRFIDCPKWMWERYTVDFDMDSDGQYKICNFNNLMDATCSIDTQDWADYDGRHRELERKLHPQEGPGGPPPGDDSTNFMNVPVLPVQEFDNFNDLR